MLALTGTCPQTMSVMVPRAKCNTFAIAHGSANEVKAAVRAAQAWGWLEDADRTLAVLDRLLALLWCLTHGRASKPPR